MSFRLRQVGTGLSVGPGAGQHAVPLRPLAEEVDGDAQAARQVDRPTLADLRGEQLLHQGAPRRAEACAEEDAEGQGEYEGPSDVKLKCGPRSPSPSQAGEPRPETLLERRYWQLGSANAIPAEANAAAAAVVFMKPQPRQHNSRRPQSAASQTTGEEFDIDESSAGEINLASSHLTLHHVQEVSTMLRSTAQVLSPRAMTQPAPSLTTAPLLGRLTR